MCEEYFLNHRTIFDGRRIFDPVLLELDLGHGGKSGMSSKNISRTYNIRRTNNIQRRSSQARVEYKRIDLKL